MAIYRNDVVTFERECKDTSGNLFDPDSHSIKFYKPNGTQYGSEITNPTQQSTGVYRYVFTVPSDADYGVWWVTWATTRTTPLDTKTIIEHFIVEEKK